MAKREFLQLAHTYDRKKTSIGGWLMSEKLDGMRAFWDGGISAGIPASQVPWANTEKDFRLLNEVVATGLWTRYGKVIRAAPEWLAKLPNTPLDGELYMGRGKFQDTVSITKRHEAGATEWMKVQYMAFDSPPMEKVFADGEINNTNFKKKFKGVMGWLNSHKRSYFMPPNIGFMGRYKALKALIGAGNEVLQYHNQTQLEFVTKLAEAQADAFMELVLSKGGEGLIFKSPGGLWEPERTYQMLKYKPFSDAEAQVIGYVFGRETDKGSKLLGLMGALVCKMPDGGQFELSGFTDAERTLRAMDGSDGAYGYGVRHPGETVPDWIHNPTFPRGTYVSYKYRELTKDGLPKEGRFYRKPEGEI